MPNNPAESEEIGRRNIVSLSTGEVLPVVVAAGKNQLPT
jgi:hypothetical protein